MLPNRSWNLSVGGNLNGYVFLGALLAAGALFGILLTGALTLEQQQELADGLNLYFAKLAGPAEADAWSAFRDSVLFYAKWLGLIWLLGLSVIGLPLVLALDFLKGMLIGFTAALLAEQLSWKGVLFFLAATGPQNALIVPALLIATVSAAKFARFIVKERLLRRNGRLLPPFIAHSVVSLSMFMLIVFAALYEAHVAPRLLAKASPAPAAALSTVGTGTALHENVVERLTSGAS